MSQQPPKPNLRATHGWQRQAARDYYLRHPDASISEVAAALNIATRTVARSREALVNEGLLAPGRNNPDSAAAAIAAAVASSVGTGSDTPQAEGPADPVAPRPSGGHPRNAVLDDEALRKMNAMIDELAGDDSTDVEETRKRMIAQVKRWVFDPLLTPDTRMSAATLWAKLVDMQRAKDLGPGKPLTQADAIERASDFSIACGPLIMTVALFRAFDRETLLTCINSLVEMLEVPNVEQTVDAGNAPPTPADPTGAPHNDPPVGNGA